jgi:hypothetical protein
MPDFLRTCQGSIRDDLCIEHFKAIGTVESIVHGPSLTPCGRGSHGKSPALLGDLRHTGPRSADGGQGFRRPGVFETSYVLPLRPFALDGAGGSRPSSWMGTRHGGPPADDLGVLFPYADAN